MNKNNSPRPRFPPSFKSRVTVKLSKINANKKKQENSLEPFYSLSPEIIREISKYLEFKEWVKLKRSCALAALSLESPYLAFTLGGSRMVGRQKAQEYICYTKGLLFEEWLRVRFEYVSRIEHYKRSKDANEADQNQELEKISNGIMTYLSDKVKLYPPSLTPKQFVKLVEMDPFEFARIFKMHHILNRIPLKSRIAAFDKAISSNIKSVCQLYIQENWIDEAFKQALFKAVLNTLDPSKRYDICMLVVGACNKFSTDQQKEGCLMLIKAATYGKLELCKLLIEKGVDVNSTFQHGLSAIFGAAMAGHFKVCQFLLQKGANINQMSEFGTTAIFKAVSEGHYKICEYFLKNGAQLDHFRSHDGVTPLTLAVSVDNYDICKLLVEYGVNVNIKGPENLPLLIFAIYGRNTSIVQLLIDGGADIHVKGTFNESTLFAAIDAELPSIAKVLIKKGVDVNWKSCKKGKSKNSLFALSAAIEVGDFELVELLVQNGANVNEMDQDLVPLIWKALQNDRFDICKLLLQHGADIDILSTEENMERTSLIWAVSCENMEAVKFLVQHGADIEKTDDCFGATPFLWAVSENKLEIAKYLVSLGCNQYVRDVVGRSCLDISQCHPLRKGMLKFLNSLGLKFDHSVIMNDATAALRISCKTRPSPKLLEAVQLLMERGAEAFMVIDGKDCIDVAREHGNLDVADYLSSLKNVDVVSSKN